jgi:hypothetical protein
VLAAKKVCKSREIFQKNKKCHFCRLLDSALKKLFFDFFRLFLTFLAVIQHTEHCDKYRRNYLFKNKTN